MGNFMIWILVALMAALFVFGAGFVYGTDKEREAAQERQRLARKYYREESGTTAALVLLAAATAYVLGHALVWAVTR